MENFESWKKFGKNREIAWQFSFSDRFFRKMPVSFFYPTKWGKISFRKVFEECVTFKYSSLFPILMEGLKPEHHGFLNGLVNKTLEEKRQIYSRFRQTYQGNPLAVEQIDIYDGESPHSTHIRIYRDALKSGDETATQREEVWLAQNHPLTSKRS